MMKGFLRPLARLVALAATALAVSASGASAQSIDSCRCVDRDGNEIERCSCVRAPRFELRGVPGFTADATRPRLGISVDARQSARRDAEGALVTDILDDGPAEDAGIRRGDVITSIDGHSLFEPLEGDREQAFDLDDSVPVQRLLALAGDLEAGEQVDVEYLRDGEPHTATIEAQELEEWGRLFSGGGNVWSQERMRDQMRGLRDEMSRFEYRFDDGVRADRGRERDGTTVIAPRADGDVHVFGAPGASGLVISRLGGARYGVELVELNPTLGAYFGVESGVLVADVREESTLGLRPGDVVLSVGDREVTSADRLVRILGSYRADEAVRFRVRREGREVDIEGTIEG
jgi:membrane-associated protease RseP (regulator of RpoE activity)